MNLKDIPQEWIKKYVDEIIQFAKTLDENDPMLKSLVERAEHAMELVKAFREAKPC